MQRLLAGLFSAIVTPLRLLCGVIVLLFVTVQQLFFAGLGLLLVGVVVAFTLSMFSDSGSKRVDQATTRIASLVCRSFGEGPTSAEWGQVRREIEVLNPEDRKQLHARTDKVVLYIDEVNDALFAALQGSTDGHLDAREFESRIARAERHVRGMFEERALVSAREQYLGLIHRVEALSHGDLAETQALQTTCGALQSAWLGRKATYESLWIGSERAVQEAALPLTRGPAF